MSASILKRHRRLRLRRDLVLQRDHDRAIRRQRLEIAARKKERKRR